jgi:hypothetical protein
MFIKIINDGDQVHNVGGQGMNITHIGHFVLHTPDKFIQLRNILYVPDASKSLLSAHHLNLDNYTFMEIHPLFSLIKNHVTKKSCLKVLVMVACILVFQFRNPPSMLLPPSSLHPLHGIVV